MPGMHQKETGMYQIYTWFITQYAISCYFTFTCHLLCSHGMHKIVIYLAYIRQIPVYLRYIYIYTRYIYIYIYIYIPEQVYTRYVLGIRQVYDNCASKLCGEVRSASRTCSAATDLDSQVTYSSPACCVWLCRREEASQRAIK
jgi:hypothetical protein